MPNELKDTLKAIDLDGIAKIFFAKMEAEGIDYVLATKNKDDISLKFFGHAESRIMLVNCIKVSSDNLLLKRFTITEAQHGKKPNPVQAP